MTRYLINGKTIITLILLFYGMGVLLMLGTHSEPPAILLQTSGTP